METQGKESLTQKLKREYVGQGLLDPELVEEEKRAQVGYLIKTMKALGRPLSEEEMRELGNIL